MEAVTPEILAMVPQGKLDQESRKRFLSVNEILFNGKAIFGVLDNDITPIQVYYLIQELNAFYNFNLECEQVYEEMCDAFDPRIIKGFRLKLCGGAWEKPAVNL